MKTCENCGAAVPGRFCSQCGAPLADSIGAALDAPLVAAPLAPSTFSARPSRRRVTVGALAAAALALCLGVAVSVGGIPFTGANELSAFVPGATKHEVAGTFVVATYTPEDCGGGSWNASDRLERLTAVALEGKTFPCPEGPGGGYADIADGSKVVLRDGVGQVLSTGRLTGGTFGVEGVEFTFTLTDVPSVDFYELEVSNRGNLTYSLEEMESSSWTVSTSVGSL